MRHKELPVWLTAPLLLGAFVTLAWLERKRPLRRHVEPKVRREVRNFAVASISALAVQFADAPVTGRLTVLAERRRWGLLRALRLPVWLEIPAAILALDYSMYLWHVLTHRVSLLWRFHVVHHVDLDLDVSTAIRFHFGELVCSVPLRMAQIVLLGPSRLAFSMFQTLFGLEVMFHHSEVELPAAFERRLVRWIVTPRMHGIHHSIVREETDSNWSSGLTVWDRLHGTLRLNVPQSRIVIGVPAWRDPEAVALPELLRMPFVSQPPSWQLPDGSPGPHRDASGAAVFRDSADVTV